jgi:glycosyl hydrolase family 25
MTIFGWDASDFDWSRGPMDLGAARAAGIDFFTHKATEGTSTRHVHYGEALRRARVAGIPFLGAYHVVRSGPSITAQVDYLLAYAGEATPWWRDHPGWFWQCDLEHWTYDTVAPSAGVAFCETLAQHTGRAVLLYAPRWAYGDSIGGRAPLWASAYVTGSGSFRELYPGDSSSRWDPYSGRTPVILQYTSSATIGRQPMCDANAFRGTTSDFARLIGDDMLTDRQAEQLNNLEAFAQAMTQLFPSIVLKNNGVSATWPNPLAVMVKAIGEHVDIDAEELTAIQDAAKAGAAQALETQATTLEHALTDALTAALPDVGRERIQAEIRTVFAAAFPAQA